MNRFNDSDKGFNAMNSKDAIEAEEKERRINQSIFSAITSFFQMGYQLRALAEDNLEFSEESDMVNLADNFNKFAFAEAILEGVFDTHSEAKAQEDALFAEFMMQVFDPIGLTPSGALSDEVFALYDDSNFFGDSYELTSEEELSLDKLAVELGDSDEGVMAMSLFDEINSFGIDGTSELGDFAQDTYEGFIPGVIEAGIATIGFRPNQFRGELAEGSEFEDLNNEMKPYADIGDVLFGDSSGA